MTVGSVTLRDGWEEPALLFMSAHVGLGLALTLKGPMKGRPLVQLKQFSADKMFPGVRKTVRTAKYCLNLTPLHLYSLRFSQDSSLGNRLSIPPPFTTGKLQHLLNNQVCRSAGDVLRQ